MINLSLMVEFEQIIQQKVQLIVEFEETDRSN